MSRRISIRGCVGLFLIERLILISWTERFFFPSPLSHFSHRTILIGFVEVKIWFSPPRFRSRSLTMNSLFLLLLDRSLSLTSFFFIRTVRDFGDSCLAHYMLFRCFQFVNWLRYFGQFRWRYEMVQGVSLHLTCMKATFFFNLYFNPV